MKAYDVLGLLLALMIAPSLATGDDFCDAELVQESRDPTVYKFRGDRCEGIFGQPVSGRHLLVRSLVETFEDFDPQASAFLRLEWSTPPSPATVHLRAHCFRPRTYYRMDTQVSEGARSFVWPTGLLRYLQLGPEDLGLVAWVDDEDGERWYLPLRATPGNQARRGSNYEVAIIPGRDVREIHVTVQRVDDGKTMDLWSRQPLGRGHYPVDQPVRFRLPDLGAPGRFVLLLEAERRNDDTPVARTFHFIHGSNR